MDIKTYKQIKESIRFIINYRAIFLLFSGVYSLAFVVLLLLKYHYRIQNSTILFEVAVKSPLIIIAIIYFTTKKRIDYKVNFISQTYSGNLRFRFIALFLIFTVIVMSLDILEAAIAGIQWDHNVPNISYKYKLYLTNKKIEQSQLANNDRSIYIYRKDNHYWVYFRTLKAKLDVSWNIQALSKIDIEKFNNAIYTGNKAEFWKQKTLSLYYWRTGNYKWTPGNVTALLAPFSEEVLFRGILYCLGLKLLLWLNQWIRRKRSLPLVKRKKCLCFTKYLGKFTVFFILSCFFMIIHIDGTRMTVNLCGVFIFSLLAFYLRDRSEGLLLPTLLHMATDWTTTIPYTSKIFIMLSSVVYFFLRQHFPNLYF